MKKIVFLAVLISGFSVVQAQLFVGTFSGASEVPANGSGGSGSISLSLSGNSLTFTSGSYTLDTGNTSVAAHIHGPAAPGVDANVLYDLSGNVTLGANSGSFSGSVTLTDPAPGTAYTLANQLSDLQSGLWYVNVHSTAFGGGEVRAQITPVPEPQEYALVASLGLIGFAVWRKRKASLA